MQEDDRYLQEQIITYIGNKRGLLTNISACLEEIRHDLGREKIVSLDMFSGSGIVARLLKQYSSLVLANDLEHYSQIINECYLSDREDLAGSEYKKYKKEVDDFFECRCSDAAAQERSDFSECRTAAGETDGSTERRTAAGGGLIRGIISREYAPHDDDDIRKGERVFYTAENAAAIDTYRAAIDQVPQPLQKYFLAPLLYEASVHTNTSGVFKGFYKNSRTGRGQFGGDGENALSRIKGRIRLPEPVLSSFSCEHMVYREDANELARRLAEEAGRIDVAYIDPPYNQHPYGSNYFMLNVIADNKISGRQSAVSGIPDNWNRSRYNKAPQVKAAFEELISEIRSRYLLISYNSEGYISLDEMKTILERYGDVHYQEIRYNTFRGSRNLRGRSIYVNEYLITVRKK